MFHKEEAGCFDNHLAKLKNAVIMMVDDEPINTDVIQIHLETAGYRNFLITDKSGEAMGLLRSERPDVLLLDLKMPDVTGFDILAEMRREQLLKHIPVIVLTSSTSPETKLKVLELGASDFLSKPVDSSELILRLQNTLTAKAYQDQLAFYDSLTGLPNRHLFIERLTSAVKNAADDGKPIGVLHIGLDRFKQINDTLGPKIGDMLLEEAAVRIRDSLRSSDITTRLGHARPWNDLARFGGDEFSIILPQYRLVDDLAVVAHSVIESMRPIFVFDEHDVYLTASIGIATYPDDADNADTLIKQAASATHHAKQLGRNNFQFYSEEINARSTERLKMASLLRKAIDNDEFLLHYQPQVDPRSDKVIGVEALLRWHSPIYGNVSPAEFMPLAEDNGMIVPIGTRVIQEACRQAQEWRSRGLQNITVSVNVSMEQFRKRDFTEIVKEALDKSGLYPGHLVLEITESLMMENAEKHIKTLHELKELGVDLSIDDFGTGYSSLSYLTRFPVDELKIASSFVTNIHEDPEHAAVGRAIIAMAKSLGLRVVAEGVEKKGPLKFLLEKECDLIQGYYYSKPLAKEQLLEFALSMNGHRDNGRFDDPKKTPGLSG